MLDQSYSIPRAVLKKICAQIFQKPCIIAITCYILKSCRHHCSQTMLKKVLLNQECTFRVLFLPKIDSVASNMDFQCKTLWNFLYSLSYWSIFNLVLISRIAEILHLLLSLQFSYRYLNNEWFLRQTFFKKAKNLHNLFFLFMYNNSVVRLKTKT